jgi:hypothetical protein
MTNFLVSAFLMLILGTCGFFVGALVLGKINFLRLHPRYLMTIGASAMPLVWISHALFGTHNALFGPDMLVMMMGVGLVAAGWDAEAEMERERDTERVKRLRAAWEGRGLADYPPPTPGRTPSADASEDTGSSIQVDES